MDLTAQILLSILFVVLGVTLTLVGIQLYWLLKELREGVKKTNLILENAEKLSVTLTEGSSKIKDNLGSLVTFFALIKTLLEKFKGEPKK